MLFHQFVSSRPQKSQLAVSQAILTRGNSDKKAACRSKEDKMVGRPRQTGSLVPE